MKKPRSPFGGSALKERIEEVIRHVVIYKWDTFTPGAAKGPDDWRLTLAALDRLRMYRLVESGFTYEALGVPLAGGIIPAQIVREHLEIGNMYAEAKAERRRLDGN